MYSLYNASQLLYESQQVISEQLFEDFIVCIKKKEDFSLVQKLSDYQLLLPISTAYPFFNDLMLKSLVTSLLLSNQKPFIKEKIPNKIINKCYPYQLDGIQKCLRAGPRALLADEPGLGKTLQSIAWASIISEKKVLIVTPPGLLKNWELELKKWLDNPQYQRIDSDSTPINKDVKWYIVSNSLVGLEKCVKTQLLKDNANIDTMIVDEAHAYITHNSQRSRLMLMSTIPNMLFITGTPLLAKHKQLYVLIKKLYPEWRDLDYYKFTTRYCGGHKGAFGWEDNESTNQLELFTLLNKKMVRRFTSDVQGQIPPLSIKTIKLQVSKADLVKYELVTKKQEELLKKPKTSETMFELNNIQMEKHRITSQIKTNIVSPVILSFPKVKTIIWYKYNLMRDALLASLPSRQCLVIGGDVPSIRRQVILNQFESDDDKQYLILSIMACNTGLNITCATQMFFADNDHTPAILIQCMARMHRIGQTKPTEAFYLIATDTYDDKILDILNKKDSVVNKTLQESRKLVIEETKSQIMFVGWEFEPYGISAPLIRLFSGVPKPKTKETQEEFILRVTKEVVYDPVLINSIRRREFAPINQLNLNQVAKWTNVMESNTTLPLASQEKTMFVLEQEENIIAIFMKRNLLL